MKPSTIVVQTSPIEQMIVKRVRLRSMICVEPNDDEPTPKAPERPASLPECASTRMITPNASSMCTAIAAMRMISLTA